MQNVRRTTRTITRNYAKLLISFFGISLLFFPVLGDCQAPGSIPKGINIRIEVPALPAPPPLPGGAAAPLPVYAGVVFEGKAYPEALVTILRNDLVAGTTIADSTGDFSLTLGVVPAGISTFGIFAEDTEGRKSVTLGFTISIIEGTITTVKGIFISPTIELSEKTIRRGETLDILGQAYPKSEIQIFVSSPGPAPLVKKTTTSKKYEFQ